VFRSRAIISRVYRNDLASISRALISRALISNMSNGMTQAAAPPSCRALALH
jgi:hypothetical protein